LSPAESVARATQWLQDLLGELSGLRNATSRDPSFKNWRQNALTILQRIWPADQDHAERFRRIPFSPVDPRADVRAQRESFSRGCQEAARVLASFVEEVRATGVPEIDRDAVQLTEESGFEDGFPTVDLPIGDVGVAAGLSELDDPALDDLPPQSADPAFTPPTRPRMDIPTQPAPPVPPALAAPPATEARPVRKGLGVAAKLRDLLGLTGFAAKPSPPPQGTGNSSALPQLPTRSLDIVPVGDEVHAKPRSASWPMPQPSTHAPGAPATPPAAAGPAPEPQGPAGANAPPAETGMSVVMSRPTTLRSNIEKVSIESLFSPEFRSGAESNTATPSAADPSAAGTPQASEAQAAPAAASPPAGSPPAAATSDAKAAAGNAAAAQKRGTRPASGSTPAPRRAQGAQPTNRPALSIVPPLSSDPEFNVDPAPPAPASAAETAAPVARPGAASNVVPLPPPPAATESASDASPEPAATNPDSAEFARATADFMRTSPVLGATGRKVQRAPHEAAEVGFSDPDAIAIVSMLDELTLMGVPTTRQSETRARLLDLARRMEADDLAWSVLRKAVWFAMEYPELARRLMPMLLPWIDRAA